MEPPSAFAVGDHGSDIVDSPPLSSSATTWLMSTEHVGPKRESRLPLAKPYLAKPSRLKPPSESKANYFGQSHLHAHLKENQSGNQSESQNRRQQASSQNPVPDDGPDDDSPFTRRIKALEQNPELAFAGSSKLQNDNNGALAGSKSGTGHANNTRPKKKTATELQV